MHSTSNFYFLKNQDVREYCTNWATPQQNVAAEYNGKSRNLYMHQAQLHTILKKSAVL
jgi:hypothetical protein